MKKISIFLIALVILIFSLKFISPYKSQNNYQNIGSYSGEEFVIEDEIDETYGNYVNFFVKNKGDSTVVISVDDKNFVDVKSGTRTYIRTRVFGKKVYKFKASAKDKKIDIDYRIIQRIS